MAKLIGLLLAAFTCFLLVSVCSEASLFDDVNSGGLTIDEVDRRLSEAESWEMIGRISVADILKFKTDANKIRVIEDCRCVRDPSFLHTDTRHGELVVNQGVDNFLWHYAHKMARSCADIVRPALKKAVDLLDEGALRRLNKLLTETKKARDDANFSCYKLFVYLQRYKIPCDKLFYLRRDPNEELINKWYPIAASCSTLTFDRNSVKGSCANIRRYY